MNVIDWIKATSDWMYADRPDLYDEPSAALRDLVRWMDNLRDHDSVSIESGGWVLMRTVDDGIEEYTLSKKIATVVVDYEVEDCDGWQWTYNSGVVSVNPDLPELAASDFDFGLDSDLDF